MNDDSILRNAFYEEADELLEDIEMCLLDIESQGVTKDRIDNLFRYMHTLKGSSGAMEIDDMAKLTHNLEDVLGLIRDGKLDFTADIIDKMFKGLDELKTRVLKHKNDEEYEIDFDLFSIDINSLDKEVSVNPTRRISTFELTSIDKDDMLRHMALEEHAYRITIELSEDAQLVGARLYLVEERLKAIGRLYKKSWDTLDENQDSASFEILFISSSTHKEIEDIIYTVSNINKVAVEEIELQSLNKSTNDYKASGQNGVQSVIRVNIEKLDKLLRIVEELSVDKERLKQMMKRVEQKFKGDSDVKELSNIVSQIDFIGNEMQESVMSTRMYTLENVFRRFPRMIRDLSHKQGKDIELKTEGESTELDRTIMEKIIDPLNHIIRNSIDHGIETPEERLKAGKNPQGTIYLSAGQEQGYIYIRVEDDGRGVDPKNLREKAVAKGIMTKAQAELLSDKEILDVIFMPGFSTTDTVTDISGRGVGMNVVKENIENINGMIDVESTPGRGTAITLKLPLTLAIIQALLIKSKHYRFALPLLSIIEIFKVKESEYDGTIKSVQGNEVISWRDEVLPVFRLANLFNTEDTEKSKSFIGIVTGFSTRKVVLALEEIIGQQQIVIKSMEKYTGEGNVLGELKGISGTAILGDGDFAYVLDIQTLINEMVRKRREAV